MDTEIAVVGGGLVGMAVAYGLQQLGRQVAVFDEGDRAFRASRGNFGLVWVQGKGAKLPDYARWTRYSASLWADFADELRASADIGVELTQPGGLDICLTEQEAEENIQRLQGLRDALDGDYPFEFLGNNSLRERVPEIGPDVVGATYCPEDGHVNPLYLLRALHTAFQRNGGRIVNGDRVEKITPLNNGFVLDNGMETRARKVVLCAGLGNARLAPMVGLSAPVEPMRGQVLICERVKPFMHYPTVQIRQVGEGAVQIGDSKENVGFNDDTTLRVISRIAHRAVRIYPLLRNVRMVRSWAALRVMSPDGHPIYDRSSACPGASLVTCHSGVTLAAVHAKVLAAWIIGEQQADYPDYMESFSAKRFDFTRLPEPQGEPLTIYFGDRPFQARAGDTVAAALLAAGEIVTRTTPVSGAGRGPFCMMGVCFDCLMDIDGEPNRQGCMVEVRDGMRVRAMAGARAVNGGDHD